MKLRTGFILLIIFATTGKLFSQQPVLFIDSTTVQIAPSDSLHFDDSLSYSFTITNLGNSVYNGAIVINYNINNSGNILVDSIPQGQVIFPGNSITYFKMVSFSPNRYITGDNIVVIWPTGIAPSTTADSVTVHLFGLGYNGIKNIEQSSKYFLAYSENFDDVQLIFAKENTPSEIQVINMEGQILLRETKPQSGKLPVQNLPTGLYLILVYNQNGNTFSIKILKN